MYVCMCMGYGKHSKHNLNGSTFIARYFLLPMTLVVVFLLHAQISFNNYAVKLSVLIRLDCLTTSSLIIRSGGSDDQNSANYTVLVKSGGLSLVTSRPFWWSVVKPTLDTGGGGSSVGSRLDTYLNFIIMLSVGKTPLVAIQGRSQKTSKWRSRHAIWEMIAEITYQFGGFHWECHASVGGCSR